MEELFTIPEVKSPRLKWMEINGLTVHHQPYDHAGPMEEDDQWCAAQNGKPIATGRNAEWALIAAAKKLGLKHWNQP